MPAVASGKVLVTGATGDIASWVVKTLLDQGFSVRGTVRSIAKGVQLQKLFAEYRNTFEFVVIEDMVKVCGPYTSIAFIPDATSL